MRSLGEELPRETSRVRGLMLRYWELPGGVGKPAAYLMEQALQKADKAMIEQDTVGMIKALQELKGFEA